MLVLSSLGWMWSLGVHRIHAEDAAQSAQAAALATRARWASMQVLQALTDARVQHRQERARCLDDHLKQINSVLRAVEAPSPSTPISYLSERVTQLLLQARTCGNAVVGSEIANGRTQIVLLINPAPPSGEPRSLETIRFNGR